jgi:hypothetical protein
MVYINYNDNTIKIDDLPSNITDLRDIIKTKYSINDFYILHKNKVLNDPLSITINDNDTLEIYNRVNGGNPILNPLKKMVVGIVDIAILIGEIFALIPKLLKIVATIFKPDKLMNDIIYGTTTGINSLISALTEKLNFSNEKTVEEKAEAAKNSNGIFGIDDSSKAICTKPTWINLIILVLCPPLSLYLHLGKAGISGIGPWFYSIFMVLVCSGMTYYMYYFPGFLFAALHILC